MHFRYDGWQIFRHERRWSWQTLKEIRVMFKFSRKWRKEGNSINIKKKTISGLCLTLTHPVSRMKWIFIILQYLPSRPFHSILIQLWSSFCTFYLSNNSWIFLCTCAGPFSSPLALWLAPYSCITESPTLKTWQSSSVKKIQSFLSLIIKLNSPIFKSEKKNNKTSFPTNVAASFLNHVNFPRSLIFIFQLQLTFSQPRPI